MTGNRLFSSALDILGLQGDGADAPSDTDDLRSRALTLINIVLAENSELDCRVRKCEHTVKSIEAMDDEIDFSEIVSATVLPYALARLLVIGEDDALASTLTSLYGEARRNALRFGKPKAEPIREVYK